MATKPTKGAPPTQMEPGQERAPHERAAGSASTAAALPAKPKPKTKPKAGLQGTVAREERAAARAATRRPRERAAGTAAHDDNDADGGRLFVSALARGLDVLAAFRPREGALGNQELAERTGLPKPTISRITHTLMQLGYLSYNPRLSNYELGGRTLSLAFTAMSNLDIRRVARPLMQKLAERGDMNISLGLRDQLSILCVETCEGSALVGLRLPAGSRMPLATASTGKAWLAAAPAAERAPVLDALRKQNPEGWPRLERSIDIARQELAESGYCTSIGEWQRDINGASSAIILPDGRGTYILGLGGPAYLLSAEQITTTYGPMVAETAREIADQLGGVIRPLEP